MISSFLVDVILLHWYGIAEWWLVIAAVPTLIVVGWQAVATANAAKATKVAAEAAQKNSEILINSERAWVLVEIGRIPDFQPDPNNSSFLWISPTIRNYGKTPARIKRIVAMVRLLPDGQTLPSVPENQPGGFDLRIDTMLPPEAPIQPIPLAVSGQEFTKVREKKLTLYVHGFIDYVDIGNLDRHSGFCFVYWVQGGFSPRSTGFYVDFTAPSAYTNCT